MILPPRPREVYASFDLPILQAAVNQLVNNLQCPYRMGQATALAVASLAVQGLVDVRVPSGQVEPVSLFILQVASSGERKTAGEKTCGRGIDLFEKEQRLKYQEEIKEFEEKLEVYEVTRQALATGLRRAIADGGDVDTAESALLAHKRQKPVAPKARCVRHDDITPEAWIQSLADQFPVSGLFTSEAAGILNSRLFNALEKLNQAWSGGTLSHELKTGRSFFINWCRLTLSLMLQGEPFLSYLERKGDKAKGMGFWARALVFLPGTTQGTRFVYGDSAETDKLVVLAERVVELLQATVERVDDKERESEVLEFSQEAATHWFLLHNHYESQIQPGGKYHLAGDHASKLASNVARVAAVLHYFEGFEGKISIQTLQIAQAICEDASEDYLSIFVPPPREMVDAQLLNQWLDQFREKGAATLPRNFARKHCPNALRSEGRFYIALEVLRQNGVVSEYLDHRNISHIRLNPNQAMSLWNDPTKVPVLGQ